MNKPKFDPSAKWAWRKVLYYVAAAVVAILGAFGILSEVQVDQWTGQLDKIIPWVLGVAAPLLAGAKTNAGSDSTATAADVAEAARTVPPQLDVHAVAEEVTRRLGGVVSTGQHALQEAVSTGSVYPGGER